MPKSAKGLRAYELSGLLFRRRCPCLHLKSPPNSSHAEFGLQTPVKQVILHAGGSNHPKSRKAIVTLIGLLYSISVNKFQSPQKPKGDCDNKLLLFVIVQFPIVPITPKAERRL